MKGSARSRVLLCLAVFLISDIWPWTEGFVNSPKIISKDGNLIFESGANRNISFRLSGNSRLTINEEYDVMDLLMATGGPKKRTGGAKDEWNTGEDFVDVRELSDQLADFERRAFGPNGLDWILRQQQNRTRGSMALMRRYQMRLRSVENRVDRIKTQLDANSCLSGPCENGGTCFNTFTGFRCQCRPAFEGTKCEVDVNECALYEGTDLGCQNGGQCQNQFGSYSCLCLPGWHGMHCSQRRADCSQSSAWELCGHGSCVPSADDAGYRCVCEPGWKTNGVTPVCGEDVDECSDSAAHTPCSTKCINLPGSFTCAPCAAGLTGNGVSCRDVDECETNNGGCSLSPKVDCINSYGSHHCGQCPIGWTGDGRRCERSATDIDIQTGQPALSCPPGGNRCYPGASCFMISGTETCRCPVGMVGSGYGPSGCVNGTVNNCLGNPCLNNGICLDAGPSNFTCLCPAGFRPPLCEPAPSPCDHQPCRNGGRCRATNTDTGAGFVCQCSPGYRGRLCETRFSSCNGMLAAPTGSLRYPPEGTGYEHNAQCAWVIRVHESSVINVTFNSFDLEDSTECRFDWLQINDGRSAAAQVIGRYCGNHLPHGGNIISSGNMLYLWFRSDNSTAKEGFDLTWDSIQPQCGGRLEFDTHGTLASPGSPGNYPKNRDCRWQLVAPTNKRIKLTFFSLHLEQHESCSFDYLKIEDTISGRQLAKYCTSGEPAPLLLPTHQAEIHFHSDAVGSDSGFQLHYSAEERVPGCGGVYTAKEGTISQSSAANSEPGGVSCEYEIQLALGELIVIQFVRLELQPLDCLEVLDITEEGGSILQDKICGSDAALSSPPAFTSQFNRVKIKFYASAGSFQLNYRMSCEFKLDADQGTITSPGYPNLTRNDRLCTYTINTAANTVISVKRIDFQLNSGTADDDDDDDAGCLSTNLRINDAVNRRILGPYCGKNQPEEQFVSLANHLQFLLTTDANSGGRGFKFEYRSLPTEGDKCGGVHTRSGEHIRSPVDDDDKYGSSLTCYWVIMAPANKAIRLRWQSFDLESSSHCYFDYVEIYDSLGAQTDDPDDRIQPLGKYCGSNHPEDLISHSRQLVIKFVSDSSDSYGGFQLYYTFEDRERCGGHVHASSGELTSPDYPANYTGGLDCDWQLTSGVNTIMEIQMEIFDLEQSPNCTADYLEIRNGAERDSPLIGRFCGREIPARIPSYTHDLRIILHTDSAIGGRGFRLRWRLMAFGCGGNLRANMGTITSPRYPNEYPLDAHCEWQIRVHPGSGIALLVDDLELEDMGDCQYDKLMVYAGIKKPNQAEDINICRLPAGSNQLFELDGNVATLIFSSDSSNSFRGFRLSYRANCVVNLTATTGSIESLNYMEPFWETIPVNCSWTIRAPRGNRVLIEVSHLERHEEHIPNTQTPGGLYIVDGGRRNVQHVLATGTVNITGEQLTVVHNASNVNFQLDYRIDGCMEELRGGSGSFSSPNHPGMYPNNMECYWLIHVEQDHSVELTIFDLDLEESVNCTKDALTVSSHQNTVANHERHCGATAKLVLTSSGHKMHVRFISDDSHNGKGFVASYKSVKSTCGGKISGQNGAIESPNYPKRYPSFSHCEWQLEVSPHHRIVFDLDDIEMEDTYGCSFDYLEAFDLSEDDTEGRSLFHICGVSRLEPNPMSASNLALVRFVSDDSISSKGFRLNFYESCGQTLTIDETDYDFIQMTRRVARNETCEWVIQAQEPSRHVIFTPTHVKLRDEVRSEYPTEGDCLDVGVKIYEGTEAKGTPRLRYCRSHPPALISRGNALTISVPLLLVEEFEGNYMTMDSSCGSLYSSLSGKFTSPYYPDSYPPNIECIWLLEASMANSLSLTLESMDLEKSDGCNRDYLEVREESERGKLIGVYCGNEVPGVIRSHGSIWMKFKSDDDNVGEGFMASYNYEHHNEVNGTEGIIESPHYPSKFHETEPYSWRITVDPEYVVVISVRHLRDLDQPHLRFYDGYSDIGARITVTDPDEPIRSTTNMVYFTANRGPFRLDWERLSKEAVRSNRSAEEQTRLCGGNQLINIGDSSIAFHSPGYPSGYMNGLKCSWSLVPANPASHAVLQLLHLDLEVFGGQDQCMTDYVRISSGSDLQSWSELQKLCLLPTEVGDRIFHGTPYLRVEFITDSSVNKTGFQSLVRTACGSQIVGSRGEVDIMKVLQGNGPIRSNKDCVWTLKVRQGRRIRISFPSFQLQNNQAGGPNECSNYLLLRNGNDAESPFLGRGKYCEDAESEVLETSSNRAYIKFHYLNPRFALTFRYEELSHACSGHIQLGAINNGSDVQFIHSPFYPNLPNPHSECIWTVNAPAEHRIMLHFEGKFDLLEATGSGDKKECQQEFVQVNDGATGLRPEIGRYCGAQKPDTIYSTGNQLRIRYFTDVTEPHMGFNASVQLARCGGSFHSSEGVIASPTREMLLVHEAGKQLQECVYTIELETGSTVDLVSEFLSLPQPSEGGNCSRRHHLLLQELEAFGTDEENRDRITDTLMVCGSEPRHLLGETNRIVLRYRFLDGIPEEGEGFRIRYRTVRSRCGETIVATTGALQTPGYPMPISKPVHCVWRLQVPKGRRVRLEILDFSRSVEGRPRIMMGFGQYRGRLSVSNDHRGQYVIGRYSGDMPSEVVSSDNTMFVDALVLPFDQSRGCKLRFSAYGESACQRFQFQANVPRQMRIGRQRGSDPIYCSHDIIPAVNSTILIQVKEFNSSNVMMINSNLCSVMAPLKMSRLDHEEGLLQRFLCDYVAPAAGKAPLSVRVPFPIELVVADSIRNTLYSLVLDYSMQSCGGVFNLEPGDNMTVRQPTGMQSVRGAIDCAWAIGPYTDAGLEEDLTPQDIQLEVSLQIYLPVSAAGSSDSSCDTHFLKVYNGPDQNSPVLGTYCNRTNATNLVVERGLFLEYHSDSYSPRATFNVSIKYGSGCGGKLTYPYRTIEFNEQYKNNVECIWEVEATPGYHIGLSFYNRFYVEDSPGCTKDYVLVQQRNSTSGNWTDLQRICGRSPPENISTTTPYMRLIFRSDSDVVADGFWAKFQRKCGGLLYADDTDQEIASPGYPNGYDPNLQCNWTVVPRDRSTGGVLVSFVNFDLEQAPTTNCLFDNLTVTTKDKDKAPVKASLCGVKHNHQYRAKESINLLFLTDSSHSGRGFLARYTSRLCGGAIDQTAIVESPRQHTDNTLPPNSNCYWNLTTTPGHKFTVKFEMIDFEAHDRCAYDGVEIFAGSVPDDRQRLGRFCGQMNEALPVISINQEHGIIHSYSDDRDPSRGFRAFVRMIPNCDERISLNGSTRYVFSKFHYANGYESNLDCHIVFRVNPDQQIRLQFSNFHVEQSPNCDHDYVELRDGAGPFADIIGRFCGQDAPPPLTSTRHTIFLRFVTDERVSDSGFEVTIDAVPRLCGASEISLSSDGVKEAIIEAPGGNYANGVSCFWKIKGDTALDVHFLVLDLQGPNANGSCVEDYLKIYNSEDAQLLEQGLGRELIMNGPSGGRNYIDYAAEHVYCGSVKPDTYYSNPTELYLKYRSKSQVQRLGFRVRIGLTSNTERHYEGLQGRVRVSNTNSFDVTIRAPVNHTLSLYYNELMMGSYECDTENLEVFDRSNRSLQRVCAFLDVGKSLFSYADELRLHVKTGSYLTTLDLTYLASPVEKGPGCGGQFYNTEGLFANPFYPANVRNNSDCRWTVRVPSNNKVLLTFEVFNLGSKTTCHTDFLEILEEDQDGEERVMRRFCGEDNPKVYKSQRSQVVVRFHKTVNYDGVGWVIRFAGVHSNYRIPQHLLSDPILGLRK
ncbi:cubilin homolog [Drosophila ficusphila]|uniref:cubilin homolog n=1 Tax=Drosophila ficusphila TaxID=30025 RepID=UPI0007E705DC|nr:cubilin homolog [Drosophila ficusphila]